MEYTPINSNQKVSKTNWYTIGDLISLCENNPNKVVKFIDSDMSPQSLISWRGSYNIPAILYGNELRTGEYIAKQLKEDLGVTHEGYKGGDYWYDESDEFYVVGCPSSWSGCHAVKDYLISGEELILVTDINEY